MVVDYYCYIFSDYCYFVGLTITICGLLPTLLHKVRTNLLEPLAVVKNFFLFSVY